MTFILIEAEFRSLLYLQILMDWHNDDVIEFFVLSSSNYFSFCVLLCARIPPLTYKYISLWACMKVLHPYSSLGTSFSMPCRRKKLDSEACKCSQIFFHFIALLLIAALFTQLSTAQLLLIPSYLHTDYMCYILLQLYTAWTKCLFRDIAPATQLAVAVFTSRDSGHACMQESFSSYLAIERETHNQGAIQVI